jgi:hypothetical protein
MGRSQRLVGALFGFWLAHGYWTEGRQGLDAALSLGRDDPQAATRWAVEHGLA